MDIRTDIERGRRVYYPPNHFSLKKAFKKVGNIAKDAVTLGTAPVKLAVSSVTGKKPKIQYKTKVLGAIGKIHDESTKKLTGTVKAVGDTITLGYATKAANLLRKKEDREQAYKYHELKRSDTGMKFVDKASGIVGKAAPIAGSIVGGYSLASGIKSLSKSTKIPPDILNQLKNKIGAKGELVSTELLDNMVSGNEIGGFGDDDDENLLASFGGPSILWIGLAIVALVLLASSKGGQRTIKRYRR
jgi:hypothetical protein